MGRSIKNYILVVVMFIGFALVMAWKQQMLSEIDAIFYFCLALAPLAIVHFLYAIYSGEISAKGLPVYRDQSPIAFYILLFFYFCIFSVCIYAAYYYGYVAKGDVLNHP